MSRRVRSPGLTARGSESERIRVHPRTTALGRLALKRSGRGRGVNVPALRPGLDRWRTSRNSYRPRSKRTEDPTALRLCGTETNPSGRRHMLLGGKVERGCGVQGAERFDFPLIATVRAVPGPGSVSPTPFHRRLAIVLFHAASLEPPIPRSWATRWPGPSRLSSVLYGLAAILGTHLGGTDELPLV